MFKEFKEAEMTKKVEVEVTDRLCPKCQKPLIKMVWFRNQAGRIDKYMFTCDNINCKAYRNPQGIEKT